MIFSILGQLTKSQKGFTLIEALVALVITGLVGLGTTMAIGQILTQGASNSNYVTASRHTMNAIYWVSRDAQMSQIIEPGGAGGFPLTLSWTEWNNTEHQVIYSIEGDKLKRNYFIDGGEPTQTVVSQYINSVSENTTCDFVGGVLTVKVTATVGEGLYALSVTKVREITPRPGL